MELQPPQEQETQELLARFRAARARRRRLRLGVSALVGIMVAAALVTAIAFAARSDEQGSASSSTAAPPGAPSTAPTPAPSSPVTSESTASSTTTVRRTTTTRASTPQPTATPSSTTSVPTATTRAPTTTQPPASQKVVVIDPGHQGRGNGELEPVGPGSDEKKAKVSDGAVGTVTGIPESELVLALGLRLRDVLTAQGIQVVMTRTSQDVDLSNIERAQIANEAGADLFVRIHADSSTDPATNGIHVLYPAVVKGWTDDIAAEAKSAAAIAQRELVRATGAKDRGIDARADMTGFNWADVPAIIPEVGFMSNPAEDRLLATPSYQEQIVAGLARAILEFLGVA